METIVRTATGAVRGSVRAGISTFLGIPFARAPEGPLRFCDPEPVDPWDGILDAGEYGVAAPQRPSMPGVPSPWQPGDGLDCLSLNLWTPHLGGAGVPVLVWLHGGAWRGGGSSDPALDGEKLAAAGVVVVTVNYRVGFEGFGHVPGRPDNRGLADQLAALRWVHANIAAFGGDPANVTVAGQSAGASSALLLASTPGTEGLVRRVVAQSVPGAVLDRAHAEQVTAAVAAAAGVPATPAGLGALRPEELLGLEDAWARGRASWLPGAFGPVLDGSRVTGAPWESLARPGASRFDLLCGFLAEEMAIFLPEQATVPSLATLLADLGYRPDAEAAYRELYPTATSRELAVAVASDAVFRVPTLRAAEARVSGGGRAWLYEIRWAGPLGACHIMDVPLTFGTLGSPLGRRLLGDPAPEEATALSESLRTAWVAFATHGDPGWPDYDLASRSARTWDPRVGATRSPAEAALGIADRFGP